MATSELVQDLIDKLNDSKEEESKSVIPIEQIISNTAFNLETQINLSKFKRILIIGMGGGCDVFSAYAYYKYLQNHLSKSKDKSTPTLMFGNCLGIRNDLKKHRKVSNYLYEVHRHEDFKEGIEHKHYGTCRLEESIPFEYNKETKIFHGPYLFAVPIRKFSESVNNINLATLINNEAMSESYKYINCDLIIGIDNGGDSLTCGIDYKNDPEMARDRQVLYSMKHNIYNIPYIHYVFGPGCDGESTVKQLKKSITNKENRFLGCFQLNKQIMEVMRDRSKLLGDTRTPNIMYSGFINKDKQGDDMITIERGRKPRIAIPRGWLCSCWVFSTKISNAML